MIKMLGMYDANGVMFKDASPPETSKRKSLLYLDFVLFHSLTIPSKSNALLASANQYIGCNFLKRYGILFRLLLELPMSDIPSNSSGIDLAN